MAGGSGKRSSSRVNQAQVGRGFRFRRLSHWYQIRVAIVRKLFSRGLSATLCQRVFVGFT
jgi:hypothetical protein